MQCILVGKSLGKGLVLWLSPQCEETEKSYRFGGRENTRLLGDHYYSSSWVHKWFLISIFIGKLEKW